MRRARTACFRPLRYTAPLAAALALTLVVGAPASAQERPTVKVGIVAFLSGPGAAPFGFPARNAAQVVIPAINAGTLPPPYDSPGLGGARIEPVYVDEAGGTAQQVAEFRNLVQRGKAEVVVGYISSGNCLAIAPQAERLQTLTVLSTCGTPRVFEEHQPRYVFRPNNMATADSVAAARYVLRRWPEVETIAGINQNYAWGQDSWRDFRLAMEALKPGVKVVAEQFPKLFAGRYSSEISQLLLKKPDVVHTSMWGTDLETFVLQATTRGLHERAELVLITGENSMFRLGRRLPEGAVLGAEGPYGLFAHDTALNRWFRRRYRAGHGGPPVFAAYHMAQALVALKAAYDRAAGQAGGEGPPGTERVIEAFEGMTFRGVGTTVRMRLAGGHQAATETAYGAFHWDAEAGRATVTDVIRFGADCVNPPPGTPSVEWLRQGMPGAECR